MLRVVNWASTCANQISGSVGQNGGSFIWMWTADTAVVAAATGGGGGGGTSCLFAT